MKISLLWLSAIGALSSINRATAAPSAQVPSTAAATAAAIKVLIVGDSISQGHEGDYTWRYRIWEWFQSQKVDVEFVGPYTGTVPPQEPVVPGPPSAKPETPPKTNGKYAKGVSSAFNGRHFALWGKPILYAKDQINGVVKDHSPDLVLVEMGFNDIGWYGNDGKGTVGVMKELVDNARTAKSNLKFILGTIPQRTKLDNRPDLPPKVDEFNALIGPEAAKWSTSGSPIGIAKVRENYQCGLNGCTAAYDGLHPNAKGEYQIAQAFSRALIQKPFQIGKTELTIPGNIPTRPTPVPSNIKAIASASGVTLTWDAVFGAFGYDVQSRLKGSSEWNQLPISIPYNRWDWLDLKDGETWEFRVRTSGGDDLKSGWTSVASVVVKTNRPPKPSNVKSRATTDGGVTVSWTSSGGVEVTEVDLYDRDAPGSFPQAFGFTGTSGTIKNGLTNGHRYLVSAKSWKSGAVSLLEFGRPVRVVNGNPKPSTPSSLRATTIDGTTVKLEWCGSPNAAGYRVWRRTVADSNSKPEASNDISAFGTSQAVFFQFPGVWTYEYCVSAVNGEDESSRSNCVVPSKTNGSKVGPPASENCHTEPE